MRLHGSFLFRRAGRLALGGLTALAALAPAHGTTSVALPEPDSLTLLTLGVAGLLIGQRIARRRD